ncbi:MAG: hypothetical protein AAGA58_05220 [Verrucomicrobiota bacterium]
MMSDKRPEPDEPQVAGNPGIGCVIIAMAFAMFTGIATYGIWAGIKQDRDIATFTDKARIPVPSELGTAEEWTSLKARMKDFEAKALQGVEAARLELGIRDLNLAVANSDLLLESREMVYFKNIEKEGLRVAISMPINRIAFWKEPRYLNGTGLIVIESSETQLFLRMKTVESPGKTIEKGFIERLAQSDLLAPYKAEDAPLEKVIKAITSVKIDGDKVIIEADPAKRGET